jgi:hypothetical protein
VRIVRQLQRQNVQVPHDSLFAAKDEKMLEMQTARITAQGQSKKSKLPPSIPDSFAIGVFYVPQPSDVPCSLQSKLSSELKAYTVTGEVATVFSLLRRTSTTSPFSVQGGVQTGEECFEVAFGLPWSHETFMAKAAERGHPANFCKLLPSDLQAVVDFHVTHSFAEVSKTRLDWCKRWLQRAAELDREEKQEAKTRHPSTLKKRLRLTREILQRIDYEDMDALKLLEEGSPLAGEIDAAAVFIDPTNHVWPPCLNWKRMLRNGMP